MVSKRVVLVDVPRCQKPEREYIQMFPVTKNRNERASVKTALLRNRPFSGTGKVPQRTCATKDFAEISGELSGAICLKLLVLFGRALELFRTFFGTVLAILWIWGSLLALDFYFHSNFEKDGESEGGS